MVQLQGKKHVNFPGAKIKLPTLTDKDKKDLDHALKMGVDFIALIILQNKRMILRHLELS